MNHVLHGLAANPALPSHLVDRLVAVAVAVAVPGSGADADVGADLAQDLTYRPDLSRAQVLALASYDEGTAVRLAYAGRLTAADVDPAARPLAALALLDEGAGRAEWARRLAADPSAARREKLASCPGLPPDVVRALADDPDTGVVAELALFAPADTAARLAAHPHTRVRRAVAVNGSTPPSLLAALLTGEELPPAASCEVCDREEIPFVHAPDCPRTDCELPPDAACDGSHGSAVHGIRLAAMGNPATPAAVAVRFAGHSSALLRRELAARADLPAETAARLAADTVPWVRATLAGNPAVGEAVLRTLAADCGHDVRRSLVHHPDVPPDVLVRLAATVRTGPVLLPRVAAASPAEAEEFAASPDQAVRTLVARRRDLPAGIRDVLARDPDARVVASVAPHPGIPEALLRAMVRRHGARVAAAVAANPHTPPDLLEELTRQDPPVRKALREIARHPHATAAALAVCLTGCLADRRARRSAAGHPALPPSVIVGLIADDDPEVAEAAAANPALPADVMATLVP